MDTSLLTLTDFAVIVTAIFIGIQTFAAIGAAFFAYLAFRQTNRIHREQIELSQNQAIISLVDKLNNMNEIDRTDPYWNDVIIAANNLELLAVLWLEKLGSRKLIDSLYGEMFIRIFEDIWHSRGLNTNDLGKDMIKKHHPNSIRLYQVLKRQQRRIDTRRLEEKKSQEQPDGKNLRRNDERTRRRNG